MVDIGNPKIMAMLAGKTEQEAEIENVGIRDLIPAYARVQVPLGSQLGLRYTADNLRQLAMALELLSRRPDLKESSALFEAWAEIKAANLKMSRNDKAVREA